MAIFSSCSYVSETGYLLSAAVKCATSLEQGTSPFAAASFPHDPQFLIFTTVCAYVWYRFSIYHCPIFPKVTVYPQNFYMKTFL